MGCSCTKNIKNENDKEVLNEFQVNNEFQENNNSPNQIENILKDNNEKKETEQNIVDNLLPKNSEIIIQNQIENGGDKTLLKSIPKNNISLYKSITTNKITKEELENFLIEYKPLNDGVNIELRSPQLCENYTIYYGEWDIEKIYDTEGVYKFGQTMKNIWGTGKIIIQVEKEN